MSDSLYDQWQKELKILLEKIEQHPSADLDAERDRVALLNTLIAKHAQSTAGAQQPGAQQPGAQQQ